jgi:hypothetical protein
MQTRTPEDRVEVEGGLLEADPYELMTTEGGLMKLPGVHRVPLLGPDGEPIDVYVDGFRVSP